MEETAVIEHVAESGGCGSAASVVEQEQVLQT